MIGNPLLLGPEGYQISRSVRLRSSATANFTRTLSASNRKTWTWSAWVKRGLLANRQALFSAGLISGTFHYHTIHFDSNDKLNVVFYPDTTSTTLITTQVFRDPSAWYHLVVAFDTTQATAANRVKVYVNGSQVTAFDTASYSAQNTDGYINSAAYNSGVHYIGRFTPSDTAYLDGYLTEINFIDGQALTPSSFGETDAITGVWKPKKYAGTYGTNGFFLNFSDNSSNTATTIGKDYSGNGNNWTPNNISVTAGSTYDSMLDVPTLWADGGNGRGNYCVWNALSRMGTPTNSAANLQTSLATSSLVNGSMVVSSGKWYYETQFTSGADAFMGWNRVDLQTGAGNAFQQAGSLLYFSSNGNRYKDGDGGAAYGASYTTSDAIGCAIDLDNNQVTWYKNNVAQSTISITAGNYAPCLATGGTACNFLSNFGQRPFSYTPPSGFKALNTLNLPTPTILKGNQFFNAITYTGTGSTRTQTGVGFQPDFTWVKRRDAAADHGLMDAVRGASQRLQSNLTAAEDAFGFTAFASDGFTFNGGIHNDNGWSFVAWNWKEGATQGFDIVTYTGNGVSGRTISHSLGVTPKMYILKRRDAGGYNWIVQTTIIDGSLDYLFLNTTAAKGDSGDTPPTSSVFSVSGNADVNANGGTYVAYLFSEVAGFSKFGSYTGNGSADGPFVFCGFRPRFIMVKRTDTVESWNIIDTARDSYNQSGLNLYPNLSNAESANNYCDVLSNGFKLRNTWAGANANGGTYIFMAVAENPFKLSLAR